MPQTPAIPTLLLLPGDDLHDPNALYAIATAYAHAGILVSEHGHRQNQVTFTFPAVVCSSFALELFLKLFLMLDLIDQGKITEKVASSHNVPSLWKQVAPHHKILIAGMFRNDSGEPHTTGSDRRLQVFEDALKELGDKPFVQWRYVHEFRESQLMSHEAIGLVVNAFGFAAQYLLRQGSERSRP